MTDFDPSFQNFLNIVREISRATEGQLAAPMAYLMELDQVFIDWMADAGKVRPSSVAVLILNAHASFRAALFLAQSGQLLPVFMTLRGALESALYANAIAANPKLESVWLHRDQNSRSRKRCREAFTIRKMFDSLAEMQDRPFADAVRDGYESTIDFGAHPNSRSIVGSTGIEDRGNVYVLELVYAHGPHSEEMRRALVACAEVGYLVLMTSLIASHYHHPQAEMLAERAQAVTGRFPEFIASLGFIDPTAGG